MTDTIQPRGEDLRNAVRWISEHKDYSPEALNRAAVKFDLSPLDTEFLFKTFLHADRGRSGPDGTQ